MSRTVTYRNFCDVCDTIIGSETYAYRNGMTLVTPAQVFSINTLDLCASCEDVARKALVERHKAETK